MRHKNIVNDAVQELLLFPHTKITDPSIVIFSEWVSFFQEVGVFMKVLLILLSDSLWNYK